MKKKLGIIDIGSSIIRLVIVNYKDNYFYIEDEIKDDVKLYEDLNKSGYLHSTKVQGVVKIIQMYKKLCENSNVVEIIAFSSFALNNAKNIKSFLDELEAASGIIVKPLNESDTCKLIYYGVVNSIDVNKGIIFDLTGCNLFLIYFNRKAIINTTILPLGYNILDKLFDITKVDCVDLILEYLRNNITKVEWLKKADSDLQLICVGGYIRNLAKIYNIVQKNAIGKIHNTVIKKDDFEVIYQLVQKMDLRKHTRIKGLSSERADFFVATITILYSFLKFFTTEKFTISSCGLRDGIIFNRTISSNKEKILADVLSDSLNRKISQFNEDVQHVNHVYYLATLLFKQLKVIHRMPRFYAKILKIACLMHDVGSSFEYVDRFNHNFYFILNSNLFGVSHRELILAAFVASFSDFDNFNIQEWNKYKLYFNKEDMSAVLGLGVLLRVSESLDKCMSKSVQNLTCDVLGDSVIIKTIVKGDCSLEIRDAMKNSREFARIFKKNLEIL